MPISKILADYWDDRIYNWLLWKGPDGKGSQDRSEGVSSAYTLEEFSPGHRGGYRESGKAVLSGEAMETDTFMLCLRMNNKFGERIYKALIVWALNDGSRGDQAARLSTDRPSYYNWVDSGKRELQDLARISRRKRTREIKTTRNFLQTVYD